MLRQLHPIVRCIIVVFFLLLTGCSRGPEESVLRQQLQYQLNTEFSQGLFKIHSFRRAGSAPFSNTEQGTTGVLVYFDAELEFLKDYSLTSWQGLNLGTLAFVIGSTESGIQGFHPKVNRKGDVLRVYGRFSYTKVDGKWRVNTEGNSQAASNTNRPLTLEGSGPDSVLKRVRELLDRQPKTKPGTRDAAILKELQLAVARIDLKFAKLQGSLAFSTGQSPGTYYEFGVVLSKYANRHGLSIHNYISEGSLENAYRVNNNLVDFALIQSDVAETMFKGWSEQNQLPNSELRSMASLWPEAVHIVTLDSSGIKEMSDLLGKRIAVGSPGSGSRYSAIRIAQAAGFARAQFHEIRELGLIESIAALETGQVDAILATEAIPSPALQALAGRRQDIRFLSLDRELVQALTRSNFAYYPLTVPIKTYPGQAQAIHTVGLAALLITNKRTHDEEVVRILEMILDSADPLSKNYYRAGFISTETMRLGVAVPLHPGAEKFYALRNSQKTDSESSTGAKQ